MKATSVFGGVQVVQIIVQIIRSKAIAVLLGPAGMGINSLLNSTIGLVAGLTNFGLRTSAVKNIAEANSNKDTEQVAIIIKVLRRWVWITGLLGSIMTLILSPWLSQLTFGDRSYTLAFIWLSITLLFNQISTGQLVLLQGLRKIKYLANANLTGALFGLTFSLPLYYLWGIDGIVPAIIVTSIINMLRAWYFASKIKVEKVPISRNTTILKGKEMLTMGFMLSISGLITIGAAYLLRIYISNTGGVEDVGLYGAGFAIINTYVGLIFSAMSTDYYPRLSAVAIDNSKSGQTINQQAEITLLVLGPILNVFLVFINWVVILLYSSKFVSINGMIQWAALGMFFKAGSWPMGYLFLAKGASKLFFLTEFIINMIMLTLNIVFYYFYNLNGLGISFLITYIIYFTEVFFFIHMKYDFKFTKVFLRIFIIQFLFGLSCFLIVNYFSNTPAYILGSIIIITSSIHSLIELDKRLDLKDLIRKVRK